MPLRYLAIAMMMTAAISTAKGEVAPEPHPQIGAQVTFFYYKDVSRASSFFEDALGLKKTLDRGWVKVYELTPSSSVGLVDEKNGLIKAQDRQKPAVMLTILTDDLEGWHARLKAKGAKIVNEPPTTDPAPNVDGFVVRSMLIEDPFGYSVEILTRKKVK
jgi:predicted enzyme related to lactoylglutathione lyase